MPNSEQQARLDEAFERIEETILPCISMMLETLLDASEHVAADERRFLVGELKTLAAELESDVFLLDLALPDVDGAAVAVELRRGSRTMRIPVVAVSARPYAGGRDTLPAAGFAGYLEKPITVAAFPDQVRGYARRLPG